MPLDTTEIYTLSLSLTCQTFISCHCPAPVSCISSDFHGSRRKAKANIYALVWTTVQRQQHNQISIMNLELSPFGSNQHRQLNHFSLEIQAGCCLTRTQRFFLFLSLRTNFNGKTDAAKHKQCQKINKSSVISIWKSDGLFYLACTVVSRVCTQLWGPRSLEKQLSPQLHRSLMKIFAGALLPWCQESSGW